MNNEGLTLTRFSAQGFGDNSRVEDEGIWCSGLPSSEASTCFFSLGVLKPRPGMILIGNLYLE